LPAMWSVPKAGELCHMSKLQPSDPEYMEVECNVHKTCVMSLKIVSITRIENAHLFGQYALKREQMNEANGPSVDNERLLWHGTVPSAVSVICNRGFNRSYCGKNATAYGRGVYFSSNFRYSAQTVYAMPDEDKNQHIFQCRVLTDHYHVGKPDLVEPPVRDKKSLALYNSVVNNVKYPVMFAKRVSCH